MTLSEYIKLLQKLEKKHGGKEVIYSCDEEGNRFDPVRYAPSVTEDEKVCIN